MSESLTIGVILALVFGSVFYYLYSRMGQSEKRVSLLENILLDLKVALESSLVKNVDLQADEFVRTAPPTLFERGRAQARAQEQEQEQEQQQEQEQEKAQEQEQAQAQVNTDADARVEEEQLLTHADTRDQYDHMSNKELKELAKGRKIKGYTTLGRQELQDALRRHVELSDGVVTLDT